MKGTGFIFLLLVFGVLSAFGQTPNITNQRAAETRAESANTETNLEETPNTSPTQTEAANSENSETDGETGAQWEQTRRILRIANDYALAADEVLTTLVIVAGNARLQGRITGNALVIGGNVELAPETQVNGTLHLIGGVATGNIAGVADLQMNHDWQMVPAAVKLIMHPYTFWQTSQKIDFRLILVIKFVLFLFMYLLVVVIFPKPTYAVSELLAHRPVGSILFSVLMLILIPLIFALLTVSIVGVPFMLLGLSLLLPLAICGKAAIFLTLGSTLFSGRLKPLSAIFGYILYFMATALPYIDWITFLVTNTIGIGICVLSGLSLMRLRDSRPPPTGFRANASGTRSGGT